MNRPALAVLALATPTAASAADLPDPKRRAEVVFAGKAAVLQVSLSSLPKARAGSSPPVDVTVDGSYVGPHAGKKRVALKAEWTARPTPETMRTTTRPKDLVMRRQASFCGHALEANTTYLLALTRADDASSDCDLVQHTTRPDAPIPTDLAAASRAWDERHGFGYIYRNTDAIASCPAVPEDDAAFADADLVAYASLPILARLEDPDSNTIKAALRHTYKDTRSRRSLDIELPLSPDDAYPLVTGTRVLVFAEEHDGQLVATRCGGTREEPSPPEAIAGAPARPRYQIPCARLPSEDAAFHTSELVAHATVHDVIASSRRTRRLRMRPETTYKDTREAPGEFFDLFLDPRKGPSFGTGQRVLVFAEPMRNQYTFDPCSPTRELDDAPASVAGAEGTPTHLQDTTACRSEPINAQALHGTRLIVYGEVTRIERMSKLALAHLTASHAYKGADLVPDDRELKFYFSTKELTFKPKERVLVFLETFDEDRLRVSSCSSTRVLPNGPRDTVLNLPVTSLTTEDAATPSSEPRAEPPKNSCATTPGTPDPSTPGATALLLLALLRRRR